MFFLFPIIGLALAGKVIGGAGNAAAQSAVGGVAAALPPAEIALWGGSTRSTIEGGRAYSRLVRAVCAQLGGDTPANRAAAAAHIGLWAAALCPQPASSAAAVSALDEMSSLTADQLADVALVRDAAIAGGLTPPAWPADAA